MSSFLADQKRPRMLAQMRGGGVAGSQPNEYSCVAHGAQIDFGEQTPYITYGLERLAVNAKFATVLVLISASSDTVGIWGAADEAV
jgi:hypothetical protein